MLYSLPMPFVNKTYMALYHLIKNILSMYKFGQNLNNSGCNYKGKIHKNTGYSSYEKIYITTNVILVTCLK